MSIEIEVSIGEFLDKLTILQIKADRIKDQTKLANISMELRILLDKWEKSPFISAKIDAELNELRSINEKLWDIEDEIRRKEMNKNFDEQFIQLARSVYITNDERAAVKKILNEKLGSVLVEEKSYTNYSGE